MAPMVFGNLFGRIKDGERGSAVVRVAGSPLQLEVHVPNRSPYPVVYDGDVPGDKAPAVGARLPVVVDREDPQRLRIEWDEVSAASAPTTVTSTPAPGVVVTTQTIDASDNPEVIDQVTDMLKAQGIDITAMTGGATIQMGQPMDPEDAEQFRQNMLGMLGSMGIEAPGAGPTFGSVPPPAVPDDGVDDVVESLERLVKLRDAGALTPEEFEAQKARILGGR